MTLEENALLESSLASGQPLPSAWIPVRWRVSQVPSFPGRIKSN